jgi:hypothetical protein
LRRLSWAKASDLWDIGFGVAIFVAAILSLCVWFPADIPTGFFHTNAIGREEPGDAFFPVILTVLLLTLAVIQIYSSLSRVRAGIEAPENGALTTSNFRFVGSVIVTVGGGMVIMYWLGPLTVNGLNALGWTESTYRALTDTAPYKYLGYVVGGLVMTVSLIVRTEGRVRAVSVMSVLITLAAAIAIFDLALNNVLLPPNADF